MTNAVLAVKLLETTGLNVSQPSQVLQLSAAETTYLFNRYVSPQNRIKSCSESQFQDLAT